MQGEQEEREEQEERRVLEEQREASEELEEPNYFFGDQLAVQP